MRIHDITIEIDGQEIKLYTLGSTIVAVHEDGAVHGYPVDDDFRFMAISVIHDAGIGLFDTTECEEDGLAEILRSLADGELT